MKKVIFTSIIAGVFAFTSCTKKNNVTPVTTTGSTTVQTIAIDYKIHAASGHFSYDYNMPDANGISQVFKGDSQKMDQTISFTWEKFKALSVKATNFNPSGSEVTVEIYVNGTLLSTGKANHPAAWASASGQAE